MREIKIFGLGHLAKLNVASDEMNEINIFNN